MQILIVIPARYGSTRLPGKPLIKIAGHSLLSRVVHLAKQAIKGRPHISLLVATDDERIAAHAQSLQVDALMTPSDCKTGTDRAFFAANAQTTRPHFVINLQGDAPFTPAHFVGAIIDAMIHKPTLSVITPVTQLSWPALDTLRENKKTTPYSGTTAIIDKNGQARWFSKQIIPAIRKETELRQQQDLSPIYRHIGLYGYATSILEQYISWPESNYEQLEGLEQLRLLDNGVPIDCLMVDYQSLPAMTGIDSPQDVIRAHTLIKEQGDPLHDSDPLTHC